MSDLLIIDYFSNKQNDNSIVHSNYYNYCTWTPTNSLREIRSIGSSSSIIDKKWTISLINNNDKVSLSYIYDVDGHKTYDFSSIREFSIYADNIEQGSHYDAILIISA